MCEATTLAHAPVPQASVMPEPQEVKVVGTVKVDESGDRDSPPGPILISGEKTIAATGTAERLAASQRVKSVVIIAKSGNTGQVYVGDSLVTTSTNDGLDALESLAIEATQWLDLGDIYLDVDTNAEGVDYYAVKA